MTKESERLRVAMRSKAKLDQHDVARTATVFKTPSRRSIGFLWHGHVVPTETFLVWQVSFNDQSQLGYLPRFDMSLD